MNPTNAHRIMFEFGGHANLAGLTLLDMQPSLNELARIRSGPETDHPKKPTPSGFRA